MADHHLAPVAPAAGQGLRQTINQEQLVGQPGVRIGHGELPELVVLPPGRFRGPGGLGPGRAELLQHRLDALGRPHGRGPGASSIACARAGLRADRPARRVRPRQVSSWLSSRNPPPIQTSHSYRSISVRNRAGSHQMGSERAFAAGHANSAEQTRSLPGPHSRRREGRRRSPSGWTRSDQEKEVGSGSGQRPAALTSTCSHVALSGTGRGRITRGAIRSRHHRHDDEPEP